MTKTVKVQEAKTHLSAILAEVESGVEVLIARGNVLVARLSPVTEPPRREWGFVPYKVPASFFDAIPDAEIEAWDR